jgi:hypothetical protein
VATGGFQEPISQVRLAFDPADLTLVEDADGCAGLAPRPAGASWPSLIDGLEWWMPDDATTALECAADGAPLRRQRVLVDQSDPASYLLYVQVVLL